MDITPQEMIANLLADNMRLRRERDDAREALQQAEQVQTGKSIDITQRRKTEKFIMMFTPAFKALVEAVRSAPASIEVLAYMMREAAPDGSYQESMRSLCLSTGLSNVTVQTAIKALVKSDFIIIGKSGRSNIYALNPDLVMKISTDQKARCAYYEIKRANEDMSGNPVKRTIRVATRVDSKAVQKIEEPEVKLSDFYPDGIVPVELQKKQAAEPTEPAEPVDPDMVGMRNVVITGVRHASTEGQQA